MMNDVKLGLKILRYAYGLKTNLAQGGIFLASGIVYTVIGSMETHSTGSLGAFNGVFFSCLAMLPVQMCYSLSTSDLVKASPVRKRVQTNVPVLLHCCGALLIYLAECLWYGIRCLWKPELEQVTGREIMVLAVIAAIMMLYMGVCYKYFVAASLVIIPFMCLWLMGRLKSGEFVTWMSGGRDVSFLAAAGMGLGILVLGGIAEYLLTLLLYRAPLSKTAQPAPLRKWL